MAAEPDYEALGFIQASGYRTAVFATLHDIGPTTPSSLRDATEIEFAHISRALGRLSDESLVECKTPDRRKGRIYVVTDRGRAVADLLTTGGDDE